DVSCLDRIYLNGYVAKLQTPGGVIWFFHEHRGKPIVSPALFEPIGEKFRRGVKDWARASGIPVISFKAGQRKADVMAPYLRAAAATGRSQVAAVGCAQEFQLVWTARRRDTDPGGKDGVAMCVETVINQPRDLGCNRLLHNLPELEAKARGINDRLLETETVGQGTALVSPVIERITRPTLTGDGRKAPALRFGDLRVQALAGALAAMLFTVTGITNRSLRALMTGLLHRPYSMNQAGYDLSRLARNGLIRRIPGRNRYTPTRDGLLFAHIYTKVYDHVLRPLMAPDRPNAPPELAVALDTLDRLAARHIASARVPTAT